MSPTAFRENRELTFAPFSYNRYLAVAARVVRRSLKEEKRLVAERRGEMDLRFARWEVGFPPAVRSLESTILTVNTSTERQAGRA